eukprot:CAMPEP_0182460518 /NCGR_PEP_ID=MMETSP1319-20130603/5373_1 /TAXON_ID=172717 /ORGANISM="Bolidomonas pacifica, Strain RCC208" /LENGTH=53 /DNA_ID=CAMNT_0024659631 /DNA_START=14 /DNA_END=172 /DNA_ORIENTATION=-
MLFIEPRGALSFMKSTPRDLEHRDREAVDAPAREAGAAVDPPELVEVAFVALV